MFLSPQQITQSRDRTLNNLLGLSLAGIAASQRWSSLFSGASQDALHYGSKSLTQFAHGQLESMTQFPATFWLECSIRNRRLLDHVHEILGEAYQAIIQSSEAQIHLFDEIIFSSFRRAAKSGRWEGETALNIVHDTLAAESFAIAQPEGPLIAESLSPNKSPRRRPTAKE